MKKILFSVAVMALALTSCTTHDATSKVLNVETSAKSHNVADLDVQNKIVTHKYIPSKAVLRGGPANVRRMAITEALKANGGGDVLVSPQFETVTRRGLFFKKIKSVTVSGHPATYKNFRQTK